MRETREDAAAQTRADAPMAEEWGWYLYGITRRGAPATTQPERGNGARDMAALALDLGRAVAEAQEALLAQLERVERERSVTHEVREEERHEY